MSPKSRWLFKEEPSHYSFDELEKDRRTVWSGVRNNLALKHLRKVAKGDLILFYHTGDEKSVVGVMRAVSSARPDPELDDEKLAVVEVEPVKRLKRPVTLAEMRTNPRLEGFDLFRMSRLSVMPVSAGQWEEVLKMSG
jgi:predicted RNA-binding protein with PUA-like domain